MKIKFNEFVKMLENVQEIEKDDCYIQTMQQKIWQLVKNVAGAIGCGICLQIDGEVKITVLVENEECIEKIKNIIEPYKNLDIKFEITGKISSY